MDIRLEKIIDAANEGIYVTDPERRFVLWNKAAAEITGYERGEIVGQCCQDNILQHVDGEGRALCLTACPLQKSIDSGMPQGPHVVYLRRKDGVRVPVEVKTAPVRGDDGAIIGGVEIFEDVSARLEQERLLQERQQMLEALLDRIGDGILFLDTTGRIMICNKACGEVFGLNGPLTGRTIHDLPAGSTLLQAFAAIETLFREGGGPVRAAAGARCERHGELLRCWTRGLDQSPLLPEPACFTCPTYRAVRSFLEHRRDWEWRNRTFSVVSSFIELPPARELWEVVVFHDVTAAKLDAALNVAGAAAHELRQPLQAVVILAGLLDEKLQGKTPFRQNIASILASCDRMDGIINKMTEITHYRTKTYLDGRTILDLDHSADKG